MLRPKIFLILCSLSIALVLLVIVCCKPRDLIGNELRLPRGASTTCVGLYVELRTVKISEQDLEAVFLVRNESKNDAVFRASTGTVNLDSNYYLRPNSPANETLAPNSEKEVTVVYENEGKGISPNFRTSLSFGWTEKGRSPQRTCWIEILKNGEDFRLRTN